ncbi:GNAT family N-acetyltransferase [Clostridium luticellarii]|uniref:Putative acetyltransferase n=1 Tax=Clostridium luticellarii TaxID=1691940 RepID=A0A2T0BFC0_9CLOT|nr:GNAT family N-acetyltransferase [Clostridium luticellarii]MCI1946497.1 GNAT family N-acetyltransferase [Clostridium luticellarii]PRR82590.1 putative acetyltransferase [Clostridium luticellarii]
MKNNLIIREAHKDDINMLIELLRELFSIEEDFVFDNGKQKRGLEMMLEDRNNRRIFAADLDGKVVGMISGQILVSTAEGAASVLVEDVVVDRVYRERGIGKELLLNIQNWAILKGAKRMQLLADKHNTSAIDFYRHFKLDNTNLICLVKKI